jgi:protein-S-isoprenylcysteine O-methyltransferase Ste14
MSLYWSIRLGLAVVLFAIVGSSRLLLSNREKYRRTLENTPLAILDVVAYNACCYLLVAFPADPSVVPTPSILAAPGVVIGLRVVGGASLVAGVTLILMTALRRRVIGGQETKEGLITSGVYQFARHPIYVGIVLISLALALMTVNVDGMMVLPLVFLANFLQSEVEEKYDVGERFREEYGAYRRTTPRFGPRWLWFALAGGVVAALAFGSLA